MAERLLFEEWPRYFAPLILLGNPNSNVGVVTLWTEKEKIQPYLDGSQYIAVGQLYSKNGINPLIRNILANPIIRYIVVCGTELSGSGENLINFFKNGVGPDYKIVGSQDSFIDHEIPLDVIDLLRGSVEVVDLRNEIYPSKINEEIAKLPQGLPPFMESEIFPEAVRNADIFPSEVSGIGVRGKTIKECWVKILRLIMYYGFVKESQHGDDQKELIGFTTVVTGEDPENIEWFSQLPQSREHLENYYSQVLTSQKIEGVHYTYGQRLRDHDGIDQIQSVIDCLGKALYSRRAVACTWKVVEDHNNDLSPCLDLVQALVQDKRLYLTAYFRSNDMFGAWPENAFALRKLQKLIADGVGCTLGDLIIVSNSAHIYESSWNKARDIIEGYGRVHKCAFDPRGNFIISIDRDKKQIVLEHQSPSGLPLREYRAENAMQMFGVLASHDAVSDIVHAMDIGSEIQKAQIALEKGLNYTQDRKLEI